MRIDNNRASFESIANLKNDEQAGATRNAGRSGQTAGGDRVRLSNTLQFANSAVSAASKAPDVRPEKVERARALLESGKLGSDPYKLADALIDKTIAKDE